METTLKRRINNTARLCVLTAMAALCLLMLCDPGDTLPLGRFVLQKIGAVMIWGFTMLTARVWHQM